MKVKVMGKAVYRPLLAMALLSSLAACSSAPKKGAVPPYDATMTTAETQVTTVGSEAAIKSFEDAARADPTRKEPWVRIAQLQFDQGQYARAIVAAEEVLQRDPDDLVADGVITVAGFRIANTSLTRLQGRGALASETARKEAKTLADTLRKTMGDAVLEDPKPKPRAPARRTRRTAAPAAAAPAAAPAARPASSNGGDPFQNLGGN
ncbi:tetratricopeptide repeat protein [Stenotrophomonas rhizophila]|uniref:tetratricopeptide repeat protein n=1 Tax=Stenotrophomonas rhizophila TaxID=216778 RepID=UPI0015E87465|nr:tetratricopeptide repeat protein [Stenotrophomonas rhizophila]MDY0955844.1 tetratricopeptide repeat protein [Stenotrophomonas rhizophila]